MALIPVDKDIDELLGKAARARGKGKGELLNLILKEATSGSGAAATVDPTQIVKAVSAMPAARSGSIAEEINEMVRSMIQVKMMKMMDSQPQQAAAASGGMEDMKTLYMMKELTKPSFTELMMMQNWQSGKKTDEVPDYVKKYMEDQEKTREMMKDFLGVKKTNEQMEAVVKPLVEQMTADREVTKENQTAILAYIARGEGSNKEGTLEGYIANALKERLTEQALDAIDRGLFKREQVVTPEGGFNWKEILDRMLTIGEEVVKKMPTRGPPDIMPVKRLDGTWVNPATNQVISEQQAAMMIQNARIHAQAMQPPQPPQAPAEQQAPPGVMEPPAEAVSATDKGKQRKKKTAEAISTFTEDFTTETGESKGEPTGDEEY